MASTGIELNSNYHGEDLNNINILFDRSSTSYASEGISTPNTGEIFEGLNNLFDSTLHREANVPATPETSNGLDNLCDIASTKKINNSEENDDEFESLDKIFDVLFDVNAAVISNTTDNTDILECIGLLFDRIPSVPVEVYSFGFKVHSSLIPEFDMDHRIYKNTVKYEELYCNPPSPRKTRSQTKKSKLSVAAKQTPAAPAVPEVPKPPQVFITQKERFDKLGISVDVEMSNNDNTCVICMCDIENKQILSKCSHEFCKECIDQQFKHKPCCPVCGTVYGKITGNQPNGSIHIAKV